MSQDGGVAISLERVSKRFGPVLAVEETTLDIRDGEFFSLLGPSQDRSAGTSLSCG